MKITIINITRNNCKVSRTRFQLTFLQSSNRSNSNKKSRFFVPYNLDLNNLATTKKYLEPVTDVCVQFVFDIGIAIAKSLWNQDWAELGNVCVEMTSCVWIRLDEVTKPTRERLQTPKKKKGCKVCITLLIFLLMLTQIKCFASLTIVYICLLTCHIHYWFPTTCVCVCVC